MISDVDHNINTRVYTEENLVLHIFGDMYWRHPRYYYYYHHHHHHYHQHQHHCLLYAGYPYTYAPANLRSDERLTQKSEKWSLQHGARLLARTVTVCSPHFVAVYRGWR